MSAERPHPSPPSAAEPWPTWITIVHPDPEVAAARLSQVREALPTAELVATCRGSEAADRARIRGAQAPGATLVHLDGIDRFRGGWPGHRLVMRLAREGAAPVGGWVRADDVDGRTLALAVGAFGLVCSPRLPQERPGPAPAALRDQILELAEPEPGLAPVRGGAPEAEAELEAWFEARYGKRWVPWMEHAVALVVGGGERADMAEVLRPLLAPPTADHARRRLRQVAELLSDEIRGNEAVLRREGLLVLGRIARLRPLVATPYVARSLQRAVRLAQADASLVQEAGVDRPTLADLLEVEAEERSVELGGTRRRGRPEAGAWRVRRELALGRVAERRGERIEEKLAALEALRLRVDRAVDAIHDAARDRERPWGAFTH